MYEVWNLAWKVIKFNRIRLIFLHVRSCNAILSDIEQRIFF